MLVMISPLQAHLSETLTSLKFATKVNLKFSFHFVEFFCRDPTADAAAIRYIIRISGLRRSRRRLEL